MINALLNFGLTRMDAQVYILLAKKGSLRAIEVGKALKMSKPQLYRSLKILESRGVASATLEHPAKFSALPFEKALDLLAKAKMKKALEEAQQIQESKDELLANWQLLSIGDYSDKSAVFTVIEGRNNIYARIQQMIAETKSQISTMTNIPSLIRADQFGLFDVSLMQPLKSKIKFRFLTELPEQNVTAMKTLLKEIAQANLSFEGRNPDLGLKLFPRMVIRDEDEILFFINSAVGASATEQDNSCIWTNCKDLVKAFIGIFEQLWRDSTDIEKKIEDIEARKITPKTYSIENLATAQKKYDELIRSAKEEILILTSPECLLGYWRNTTALKDLATKHVSIRIMVPITSQTLEAVKELTEFGELRHAPLGYIGVTIVDKKHLVQFTNPAPGETTNPGNVSYTNDSDYVGRIRNMLNQMWENAPAPSTDTVETILKPILFTGDYPEGNLEAAERMRKQDEAKLYSKQGWLGRGTIGKAIIRPPSHLHLPDIMIQAKKIADDAAFGGHDVVVFFLRLPTPSGERFTPVGIINNGERSVVMEKVAYAGTPAEKNILIVKRAQLEVRKQGNTLFAGWTVPIQLLPSKHVLPPSCILFEAVGEPTHHEGTSVSEGHKRTASADAYQAIVTFINPSLNYVGPGTDGALLDGIGTNIVANEF